MEEIEHETLEDASARKQSHIELAMDAQNARLDERFYYEPFVSGHPVETDEMPVQIGDKQMRFPIWISSMTGGSSSAGPINKMLAKTAAKFGLGMGLGSCRIILDDNTYFSDFNLRPILGDALPLYANIGIAQVEKLIETNRLGLLTKLVERLDADGLIVHVNPLQEWLQKEGDRIKQSPLITLEQLRNEYYKPLIVKEVGQGFGPESMRALLQLPLTALDFAANGGTNFAKLEMIRTGWDENFYKNVAKIGHSADQMVDILNKTVDELGDEVQCKSVIVSGGVKDFLDGYYYISKVNMEAIYGQAAPFLYHANQSQESLDAYAHAQIQGLLMAKQFLRLTQTNG